MWRCKRWWINRSKPGVSRWRCGGQFGDVRHGRRAGSEPGLLHAMSLSKQAVGMFCGMLHREAAPARRSRSACCRCFSVMCRRARGVAQDESSPTVSRRSPGCCRCVRGAKVQERQRLLEQIDKYITNHSTAALTHGVSDCKRISSRALRPKSERSSSSCYLS